MSDAQRFLLVSTTVCHLDDEDCDSTGRLVDVYGMVTTVELLCLVAWQYWLNRKLAGFVDVACCSWTASVSQDMRTKLVSTTKTWANLMGAVRKVFIDLENE
jgi:hypothetical protein